MFEFGLIVREELRESEVQWIFRFIGGLSFRRREVWEIKMGLLMIVLMTEFECRVESRGGEGECRGVIDGDNVGEGFTVAGIQSEKVI